MSTIRPNFRPPAPVGDPVAYGPPPADRPDGVDAHAAHAAGVPLHRIKAHLFLPPDDVLTHTYAVVDGANCPELLDQLYDRRPDFACLYSGRLGPDMAEVAPYLVRLEAEHPFTDWLLAKGWGRHWGVFVQTEAELPRLRRHLRTLLMVYDPDGKPMYFRWYDPRVLRVYLPTCNAEETRLVFGPISMFLMEDAEVSVLSRFMPQGAVPVHDSMILTHRASAEASRSIGGTS